METLTMETLTMETLTMETLIMETIMDLYLPLCLPSLNPIEDPTIPHSTLLNLVSFNHMGVDILLYLLSNPQKEMHHLPSILPIPLPSIPSSLPLRHQHSPTTLMNFPISLPLPHSSNLPCQTPLSGISWALWYTWEGCPQTKEQSLKLKQRISPYMNYKYVQQNGSSSYWIVAIPSPCLIK
uniref:Uncharacterized protein n=2 Tax=Arcella intermedia TaxID=1963864 RepID=A0A6B2LIZ4_9EUKA